MCVLIKKNALEKEISSYFIMKSRNIKNVYTQI